MDLTTYTGLQAALADYLNRGDLTAQIQGFIALAESELKLDVRRKTIRATLDISAESNALPADCLILRSAYPLTGSVSQDLPLPIGTPEQLAEVRARHDGVLGRPVQLAVVDTNLIVAPAPDQTYTLQVTYFEKFTPLSGTNATNSILAEAPGAYLYGALKQAAPFLVDDDRMPTWGTLYDTIVAKLNSQRQDEEMSTPLKPARLPVVFG